MVEGMPLYLSLGQTNLVLEKAHVVSRFSCILCELCVRYCAEVKKKNAIGFIGRGTERGVMFFLEIASEECPECGECY